MIMFPDRSTLSGGTDMKSDFPGKLKSGSLKKFGMEFRRPLPILALSPFSGRFFRCEKHAGVMNHQRIVTLSFGFWHHTRGSPVVSAVG
jgi:hypothetical protein